MTKWQALRETIQDIHDGNAEDARINIRDYSKFLLCYMDVLEKDKEIEDEGTVESTMESTGAADPKL